MKLAIVFLVFSSISQAFAVGSNLEPDKFSSGNQNDPGVTELEKLT